MTAARTDIAASYATRPPLAAVLFDLDGTLVDSAPDLAGAANELRAEQGLSPLPYERLRPMVGAGARGMLAVALGITPEHEAFAAHRDRFLTLYEARMTRSTQCFAGIAELLAAIAARGLPWGIVTNKVVRFAEPVARHAGLLPAADVLVGGDSTPRAKPHPDPLLAAAQALGVAPAACAYIGDDLRDVQAGRAAGMATAVACWGYLGQGEPVQAWGGDVLLEAPADLLPWIDARRAAAA